MANVTVAPVIIDHSHNPNEVAHGDREESTFAFRVGQATNIATPDAAAEVEQFLKDTNLENASLPGAVSNRVTMTGGEVAQAQAQAVQRAGNAQGLPQDMIADSKTVAAAYAGPGHVKEASAAIDKPASPEELLGQDGQAIASGSKLANGISQAAPQSLREELTLAAQQEGLLATPQTDVMRALSAERMPAASLQSTLEAVRNAGQAKGDLLAAGLIGGMMIKTGLELMRSPEEDRKDSPAEKARKDEEARQQAAHAMLVALTIAQLGHEVDLAQGKAA